MSFHRFIWLNLALIVGAGLFGLFTDEPYWRAVGHGPRAYDYLLWFALAINGPSGLLADLASFYMHLQNDEVRFVAQYILWALLLVPQWRAYDRLKRWARVSLTRKRTFYGFAVLVLGLGYFYSVHLWSVSSKAQTEFFVDGFFWPVRIIGVALAGVIVSMFMVAKRSTLIIE